MSRKQAMSGGIIADDFFQHPKVVKCSDAAIAAWAKGLSWVARKRSNGRISAAAVKHLKMAESGVAELVSNRLWDEHPDGGWVFHNYQKRNRSDENKAAAREAGKERAAKSRAKSVGKEKCESSCELAHTGDVAAAENRSDPGLLLTPNSAARAAMKAAERTSNVVSIEAARSAESIGAQWYTSLTATTPDFDSWRKFYATIGAKPKHERDLVARHASQTDYFMTCPSGSSPEHFVTFWHDFVKRPRNMERARPPVNTRPGFQPGTPTSRSEIERLAAKNPEWAKTQ